MLKVLELVVHLLELHQDSTKSGNDPKVCRVCFAVINEYLNGNSRKNKIYITRMVNSLFSESVSLGGLASVTDIIITIKS